jgi:predicted RNase H-like HicB family nuclease
MGECLKELKKVQKLWLESARRNNQKIPTVAEVTSKLRKLKYL